MKFLRCHWRLLGQSMLRTCIKGNHIANEGVLFRCKRLYSQSIDNNTEAPWSCRLKNRSVISLSGKDTVAFLQGLTTNDVFRFLDLETQVQYQLMLNVQGRVLYDLFLYKFLNGQEKDTSFLMDADSSAVSHLLKMFKLYKIRRKVAFSDVSEKFEVWAHSPVNKDSSSSHSDAVTGGHDPRVPSFGNRFIRPAKSAGSNGLEINEREYCKLRYSWGIPEGVVDLPPGNCLPLESNAIFMNGVDFQKGCYIGQELTARTFHTGVTRKRIMPILLEKEPFAIEHDSAIKTGKGKSAGKFRGSEGTRGLALVRLAHIKEQLTVDAGDEAITLTASVPDWWPALES